MLNGLVALSMKPQSISERTGLAAKPAIAARTAVPWKRELPKDLVISLDMITHMAAMKMMTKRITFSVKRALMPSNFETHRFAIFFSSFRRKKQMTTAITRLMPSLPQEEMVGCSARN